MKRRDGMAALGFPLKGAALVAYLFVSSGPGMIPA